MALINRILEKNVGWKGCFYLHWSPMRAVSNRLRSHPGAIILNGKMDIYVTSIVSTIHAPRII